MHERKILQQLVTNRNLHLGAVAIGERARGFGELRRPQVVRRRVDQVAGEEHRLDGAAERATIDAFGQRELRCLSLGLAVARETVAAERESERRKARVRERRGKAPDAGGKNSRELSREQRVVRAWQQEVIAGLGLERRGFGEGAGQCRKAPARRFPVRVVDEPDRLRLGGVVSKGGVKAGHGTMAL
jgi:hypothetical protein